MNERNIILFVLFSRRVVATFGGVVSYPFRLLSRILPSRTNSGNGYWQTVKTHIYQRIKPVLPEWIEYRGNYTLMAKTTRGREHIESVAGSVPDTYYKYWERLSLRMMLFWVTVWGLLFLLLVAYTVGMGVIGVIELLHSSPLEWLQIQPEFGETQTGLSISDLVAGLIRVITGLVVWYIVWLLIFLVLLPGISLHEFGHYLAAQRENIGIDSYGVLLVGPIPMGAFVNLEDGALENTAPTKRMRILAGGIGNTTLLSLVWLTLAAVLYLSGLVALGTLTIPTIVFIGLVTLGGIEVLNIIFNTFPVGGVDGGLFVQAGKEKFTDSEG